MRKKILIGLLMMISVTTYAAQCWLAVDAGSTGNRIFVYKIKNQPTGIPDIKVKYMYKDFAPLAKLNSAADAGSVMSDLLNKASDAVNKNCSEGKPNIKVSVLATAGMRNLEKEAGSEVIKAIYNAIVTAIENAGFAVGDVGTLLGKYEGVYAWIGANYLNDSLKNGGGSYGIVEMGGASSQIAFSTKSTGETTEVVGGNSHKDYVYSISYLGLGQNDARISMRNNNHTWTDCYPSGNYQGDVLVNSTGYNLDGCINNYKTVMSDYSSLKEIRNIDIKKFNKTNFYGLSSIPGNLINFFWISDPTKIKEKWKAILGDKCIGKSYDEMNKIKYNEIALSEQCANATYEYMFLYGNEDTDNSLHIADGKLFPVFTINGIELNWTLGYLYQKITNPYKPTAEEIVGKNH